MAKSSTRRVTIFINGKEVEASVKQIRAEMNRLVNEQNRMVIGSDEYVAHAKRIRELREILKEHSRQIGTLKSGWEELYDKVMQFGTSVGGLTQILSSLDNITSTLKQVATDLAAMDDVYSDVIKTTGLTREEVDELNESFKNLDTRTSREQLNNLAYIAGKLGISSKEMVQQFVEAADIINVSMGDVLGDDATLAIGKMVDVYKKSTDMLKDKNLKEQLLSLGSAVNELGKTSTANEQYMVNFTGRLGGIAVQAGLAADEILGFASALDQDMQKVEMSATAFQKLIQKVISKPAEFAQIAGMELNQFKELIENDMNTALKKVLAGFSGAGGFDKLRPIFQDLGLDGARAAAAISSMANSLDKVEEAQSIANKAIKEDRGAELWNEEEDDTEDDRKKKANKKRHKDTDARWTKKGGRKFYGYKTHTKIDAKSKLIKKTVTTSAEQHDSVPTKLLIDSDDYGQELYADSAYIGKGVKNLMRRFGMKDRVIKRKVKGKELSKRQQTLNRKNASPRARVEHLFGYCEQSMHGMFSRAVGFARNAARNILTSLVYNMMRYEQIQRLGMN